MMGNYNNTIGSSRFSSMPESKYCDLYTSSDPSSGDGVLSQTACNEELVAFSFDFGHSSTGSRVSICSHSIT